MTKKEAIENHRKMWNWIADQYENMDKRTEPVCFLKREFFSRLGYNSETCCFLCDYANGCDLCPVNWASIPGNSNYCCSGSGDIYEKLSECDNPETAAKLSRIIANLPKK